MGWCVALVLVVTFLYICCTDCVIFLSGFCVGRVGKVEEAEMSSSLLGQCSQDSLVGREKGEVASKEATLLVCFLSPVYVVCLII